MDEAQGDVSEADFRVAVRVEGRIGGGERRGSVCRSDRDRKEARLLHPLSKRKLGQERQCQWLAAPQMPRLWPDLQRRDGDAAGPLASEAEVACPGRSVTGRHDYQAGGDTAEGGAQHGVSLASPLSGAAQDRSGSSADGYYRSR